MDIKKQFQKNLHRVLSMRGIRQNVLADAIGVPATTVSGWCCGRHLPDLDKLMVLCNFLEMPVGELVGDKRHPYIPEELANIKEAYIQQHSQLDRMAREKYDLERCVEELKHALNEYTKMDPKFETVEESNVDSIKSVLEKVKDAGVERVIFEFRNEKEEH